MGRQNQEKSLRFTTYMHIYTQFFLHIIYAFEYSAKHYTYDYWNYATVCNIA